MTIDNDIFVLKDWYYTAGHELFYRRMMDPKSKINEIFNKPGKTPSKFLMKYRYGNKIFTPREIEYQTTRNLDRPYAGWHSVGFALSQLKGKRANSQLELEVGLIGSASHMEQIQTWWHSRTGFQPPRGWEHQINNEVVINLNYQWMKNIKLTKELDIITQSGFFCGTGLTKLSQDFTVRVIDMKPLTQSIFNGNRLGIEGNALNEEVFLFYTYGIDYIGHNIFLEGSLFENRASAFTVNAVPWLFRSTFGIMYAKNSGSFAFSVNSLTREIENGEHHSYARLRVAKRF